MVLNNPKKQPIPLRTQTKPTLWLKKLDKLVEKTLSREFRPLLKHPLLGGTFYQIGWAIYLWLLPIVKGNLSIKNTLYFYLAAVLKGYVFRVFLCMYIYIYIFGSLWIIKGLKSLHLKSAVRFILYCVAITQIIGNFNI